MTGFWLALLGVSFSLVAYAHVGYPSILAFLAARARLKRRNTPKPLELKTTPTVSIICAAWNEETVIAAKIDNALDQDYPRERLELVIASDGSDDRTNEIVGARLSSQVRLVALPHRGGKARAIRQAAAVAKGEVFVLTDANAFFARDAVSRLVERLFERGVSCAFGRVELRPDGCPFAEGEGLFYRLERRIQKDESDLDSVIGVDGALYAIRRESFVAPPDGSVLDDLEVGIEATRAGRRVVYEPRAIAWEDATPSLAQEFRRKTRIVAGAVQALRAGRLLPDRSRRVLWFEYASHKLLRWISPVFLIVFLVASAALASERATESATTWEAIAGACLLGAQLAFYGLALAGLALHRRVALGKLGVPLYFTAMHAAALVGLVRGLRGRQTAAWKRADRRPIAAGAAS
jgi:cellulose synthase/poly-beta-1,6-N-acetylglucosamine synthase-like glycosyltransferase